jgi:hypothetical protein
MRADWVAATVRARALTNRRLGAGGSRLVAARRDLPDALAALSGSVYASRLLGISDLAAAERATRDTVLWQLRVLAGWVPATESRLCRAAAGGYERDNIVDLAGHLDDGRLLPAAYGLGTLGTAWSRVGTATSLPELAAALRRSPWGDVGADGTGTTSWRDALTLVWLRRLADVAPAARPWVQLVGALNAARIVLVDRAEPSPRLSQLLRPVIGSRWESAGDVASLRDALPRAVHAVLRGVDEPDQLWRAEARVRGVVEADGFRLLRTALPGPDVILGAIAVLAVDAWRVRAALAAACLGTGSSEVLDAVA